MLSCLLTFRVGMQSYGINTLDDQGNCYKIHRYSKIYFYFFLYIHRFITLFKSGEQNMGPLLLLHAF